VIKLKVNEGTANFFIAGPGAASNSQITLGFEMLTGPVGATTDAAFALGCAGRLNLEMVAMITGILGTGWQYRGVHVKLQRLPDLVESNLVASVSGATASPTPPSVAVLVNKVTGLAGRKERGRWFLPGMVPDVSVNDDGTLAAAYLATMQTRCTNFLANIQAPATATYASVRAVLLHNAAPGATSSPQASPIQSLQVQSLIGTQRRRLR
jgi:hypothetical protein